MRKKKARTKQDTSKHAIMQVLRAAELNPEYYDFFKTRKIDFHTFIELTAEDLITLGITDEAERNALLSCLEVMSGPNSHFTTSPSFDIQETVHNTKSILLRVHADLILMKRDLCEKIKNGHTMYNTNLELEHTSTSSSLHFLQLMDEGLEILENDYTMMLDSLDKNKTRKCHSYQMILCVAPSALFAAVIGGFLVKRFLL